MFDSKGLNLLAVGGLIEPDAVVRGWTKPTIRFAMYWGALDFSHKISLKSAKKSSVINETALCWAVQLRRLKMSIEHLSALFGS